MAHSTAAPCEARSEGAWLDPDANFVAKVRELAGIGGEAHEPQQSVHAEPTGSWGCERDLDLIDWGVLYGVAWATERLQNPERDEAKAADRVSRIARDIAIGWGGRPIIAGRPKQSDLVDDVLLAAFRCGSVIHPSDASSAHDLEEALHDLTLALGVPTASEDDAEDDSDGKPADLTLTGNEAEALREGVFEFLYKERPEVEHRPLGALDQYAQQTAVALARMQSATGLLLLADSGELPAAVIDGLLLEVLKAGEAWLLGAVSHAKGDAEELRPWQPKLGACRKLIERVESMVSR